MAAMKENLNSVFDPVGRGLGPDILEVLESILRLHSISPDELFIKWEVYSLKMGSEETKMDLPTARMFAKDVQDAVERGLQDRNQKHTGGRVPGSERKRAVHATPRAVGNGDVFGMYVPGKERMRFLWQATDKINTPG